MQKIYVKNFMALTSKTTIDLKNLLVIIGEQASGKSTLAKLIYFFRSLKQDFFYASYENFESSDTLFSAFFRVIRNKFYNFFGSTRHLSDFEITFYYSSSKYIKLSLFPDKSLKIFYSDNLKNALSSEIVPYLRGMSSVSARKNSYELLAFQEAVNKMEHYINTVFDDNSQTAFFPAGRTIPISYPDKIKMELYMGLKNDINNLSETNGQPPSTDVYMMVNFMDHIQNVKDKFTGYDFKGLTEEYVVRKADLNLEIVGVALEKVRKILRGDYRSDLYGEKIFFSEDNFVFLQKASSGQQEIIRILQDIFLILLNKQKTFRVIEEPEVHLFPLAQKHVMELILLMLNYTNSEVVITTHSPYILSILNNLIFAAKVAKKSDDIQQEVSAVLNNAFWLDPDKCGVYAMKDGACVSILSPKTGMISQNYLDEISEELGADFEQLYEIYGRLLAQ